MKRSVWFGLGVLALAVMFLPRGSVVAEGRFLANGLLPPMPVPADNPMSDAKVTLGKSLYFDKRLSSNNTVSCASCHRPDAAWADVTPVSEGVDHQKGGRNSPTILNAGYIVPQFWDGRALHLEKQAVGPVANPVEMDLPLPKLIDRLKASPGYVSMFKAAFNTEPTEDGVAKAIASFERTIVSSNSPYDKYLQGDRAAMSRPAVRGMDLFNGKGHCLPCHSGPVFTDQRFHNLGVGYKDGKFADVGRYAVTKNPRDLGAFRTPGLRSVALTPPYLHDGSEPTLEAVVELYDKGGIRNPRLDPMMLPLHLSRTEKTDLVEFLKALTGDPVVVAEPELPR
ncbi:MAG: cytochrome c peroxidase [Armatimonadota bacterium]